MGTKHIFTCHQPYSHTTIKVSYPGRHGDTFLCPLVCWCEEPECCCHPACSSWTLFPTIARKPRAERACPQSAPSYRGRPPRTTGIPILGAFPGYLEKNQQLWQKLVNVCNVGNVKSFSGPVDKLYRDRVKAGNKESTGTYMH